MPFHRGVFEVLVADFDTGLVISVIEVGLDLESCFGGGAGDQVEDDLVGGQWAASELSTNESK